MALRRPARRTREPIRDSMLAIAASLQTASSADEALGLLTDGLADRNVRAALFVQTPDSDELRVERSTLPLVSDVWGRSLRLPLLASAIARGRPALQRDVDGAFTEVDDDGDRSLLDNRVGGSLIIAPLSLDQDRAGALCLAARSLSKDDLSAAWGLGLALANALRPAATNGHANGGEPAPAVGDDISLFHDLTRRLSYSLDGDEVVRAGLEALAPAIAFQAAVAVAHRDGDDATTFFAPKGASPDAARTAASGALEAFLRLTGGKHRSCRRPPLQTLELESSAVMAAGGPLRSTLDAPLVIDGEVAGLLQIGSTAESAFDPARERLFYTVANQISLALERTAAQRQAERAHLASLADSLSDGVVLVDADLRITSLNAPAQELLGETRDGDTLEEATLVELAREALAEQRPTDLRDLASGSPRSHLMAMAAPLAGSPEGSAAVVVLRDVTEERLMQERLLQSEKMVSVGQLVSGVAHELNNPLTGITGFAQLLLARELDDDIKRDVETIYGEAERASKIVQNLLSFARRKHAAKERADLNVLVERVLELRTYDFRVKNMDLALDLDPELPKTMVDANQIQQVFLNVVINAEQAMLAAGEHGTLTVRSRREGDVIRFTFQDNGPGMAPETLRRIFDPFFTTKETGEGTGLGLTISYGIIEDHGGRIWAESAPGRGTNFTIELPVVQGEATPSGPVEAEPEEPSAPGSAILVVDDEESIQRLLASILEMDGHRVDKAGNGAEALEHIDRRSYDLVITDIKMPEMDGRELYDRLRERNAALAERTVFITGDTVSPETREFLQRVDNPCLAKPFRVRQVRETIAAILERSRA